MRSTLNIFLYQGTSKGEVDFEALRSFLQSLLPDISGQLREEFISHFAFSFKEEEKKIEEVARTLAQAKVRNIREEWKRQEPLRGEIAFERRYLFTPSHRPFGILYDAWQLQRTLRDLMPPSECDWEKIHVVITNQLFGTWDGGNFHYHCRTAFFGFPSLISTTGMVEAPAKPRSFYLKLQMGIPRESLRAEFQGRFLDLGDPRMTEVLKGYVLQALFYHLTGNPFCSDPDCRLFNAHWQEELIRAQLRDGADLCPVHGEALKEILRGEKSPR